jgi:hypothetical protein
MAVAAATASAQSSCSVLALKVHRVQCPLTEGGCSSRLGGFPAVLMTVLSIGSRLRAPAGAVVVLRPRLAATRPLPDHDLRRNDGGSNELHEEASDHFYRGHQT